MRRAREQSRRELVTSSNYANRFSALLNEVGVQLNAISDILKHVEHIPKDISHLSKHVGHILKDVDHMLKDAGHMLKGTCNLSKHAGHVLKDTHNALKDVGHLLKATSHLLKDVADILELRTVAPDIGARAWRPTESWSPRLPLSTRRRTTVPDRWCEAREPGSSRRLSDGSSVVRGPQDHRPLSRE